MPSRFEYERAVRASGLPPLSRLLALTIATYADPRTGIIPDRKMPSLSTLREDTGMSHASVLTHLDALEKAGWIRRLVPDAILSRQKKVRTKTRITLPKGFLAPGEDGVQEELDLPSEDRGARSGADLDETDSRSGADPLSGLSRSGADQGLGQELTTPGPLGVQKRGARNTKRAAPTGPSLHALPEDFALNDGMRRWANLDGYSQSIDIDFATKQFISHFRANGSRRLNWPDEWQKWIRREAKYEADRRNGSRRNSYTDPAEQGIY